MPLGLGPRVGTPSTSTLPSSGRSKPEMMFISVDLPQPDGPTIATNSPSATDSVNPSTTGRRPASVSKPFFTPWMSILADIAPLHCLESFEQAGDAVQQEPDQADDDHAGDDEVVAVSGVARVHDHVAQPRAQRDHLGRHDDQPGDAQPDAHAHDDLR